MQSTAMKDDSGILSLPLPGFVPRRYRPGNQGTWSAHLAFANHLIAATQPRLIVELGSHWGESYFGFCQSVAEHNLDCLCYAVDHWLGDAHANQYGEEVYEDVRRYNDAHYKSFSYLLRTPFDDAVSQFKDGTIDLLHIDGLHTYEAARHDFRTWLPKVKPGGVILLHDTAVRHADFGIWRLWDEIKAEFPETFEFHHGWGLGVLRKPGGEGQRPDLLQALFNSSPSIHERIRRFYVIYASHLENTLARAGGTAAGCDNTVSKTHERAGGVESSEARVMVYPFGVDGYSEQTASSRNIETMRPATLTFDLPNGIGAGRLRVDPADCACIVELDAISITSKPSGKQVWSATDPQALRQLQPSGTAVALPDENQCLLFSYGDDPQIILPLIENDDTPLLVEISLKLDAGPGATERAVTALQNARATAEAQTAAARVELNAAYAEYRLVAADAIKVALEKDEVRRALRKSEQNYSQAMHELAAARISLELERKVRQGMEHSRSWRITRPLRSFMLALRGKPRSE